MFLSKRNKNGDKLLEKKIKNYDRALSLIYIYFMWREFKLIEITKAITEFDILLSCSLFYQLYN